MVKANKLYGSLLINVFILLPLVFETYNPSLAISFSGLGYILCPLISLVSIRMLFTSHYPFTVNDFIIVLGHSFILVYIVVRIYAFL